MQGLHSPSLHTQRQLKEALYNQIVNYFDQGKVSSAPCSTALLTFLGPRFPHSITAAVLIVGATRLYATEDA